MAKCKAISLNFAGKIGYKYEKFRWILWQSQPRRELGTLRIENRQVGAWANKLCTFVYHDLQQWHCLQFLFAVLNQQTLYFFLPCFWSLVHVKSKLRIFNYNFFNHSSRIFYGIRSRYSTLSQRIFYSQYRWQY